MISNELRRDFNILKDNKLVYFDNACTTLKPRQVVEAVSAYYLEYSGCAGRSMHRIGKRAEEAFEDSRKEIARFVGAREGEVVFTKNGTEAMNLVSFSFSFNERNKVVTSVLEHHSAFLPFQRLGMQNKVIMDIVYPDNEGVFEPERWTERIDRNTGLVVVHGTNNTLGTSAPLREIIRAAHDQGARVLVDGAQSVPHGEFRFDSSGADFLAFSGHKMLGPTGIGCLVGKSEALEKLDPFLLGGETIQSVSLDKTVFAAVPHRFEAGIQNYSGAIGLAEACRYLGKVGMENVCRYEKEMFRYALEKISAIENIKIYGTRDIGKRSGIFTFNIDGITCHEVAIMLDSMAGVCVRSGVFCAEPGMEFLGIKNGAVRASFYIYNTKEEVDKFADTLKKIAKLASK